MEVQEIINDYIDLFDKHLKKYVNPSENDIIHSLEYSLFLPCKRLRPLIMISFYNLCGGNNEEVYKFAVALEMIHTFSLIHDDLPCMDNDKIRRGKKCNHIEFGENVALLAGDLLITKSFKILSDETSMNPKMTLKCINILAQETQNMIFGQYDECKNKNDILSIYSLKTSSLFVAAAKIGTLLADGNELDVILAEQFAQKFGILFQMIDDVLDKDINLEYVLQNETILNRINNLKEDCLDILKNLKKDSLVLRYIVNSIYSKIKF